MNENLKSFDSRLRSDHFRRYLSGAGLHLIADDDALITPTGSVPTRDASKGDRQFLAEIADESLDFIYSSDVLEHVYSVRTALRNWVRVLRPGGVLFFLVPDYLLYEKMSWPSPFNGDHKYSFSLSITRRQVNRQNHYHVYEDIAPLLEELGVKIVEAFLNDELFDYNRGLEDQTAGSAMAHVCVIGVKNRRGV